MSLFSRIFGRKNESTVKRNETVEFDEIKVIRTMRDGKQEILKWSDLQEVAIITTDEGPFVDDVFWALTGSSTGCLVPTGADGAKELLAHLQKLPGFNNEAAIRAMSSTDNAKFVCWRKSDGL